MRNNSSKTEDSAKTDVPPKVENPTMAEPEITEELTPTPNDTPPTASSNQPEPLVLEPSQQQVSKTLNVSSANLVNSIDYKAFLSLTGIFDFVGGDRPVKLNANIQRSQASGIPEPLVGIIQEQLKKRYVGASVDFPWGSHIITEKNRVFQTRASLVRYQMFDSLRDDKGTHVQYAKQWLALQYPAFEPGFNPTQHMSTNDDALDIYVLLLVAHSSMPKPQASSEADAQLADQMHMINLGMSHVSEQLRQQSILFDTQMRRMYTIEIVRMLEQMGLLVGNLPRDMEQFVAFLEKNRSNLTDFSSVLDKHIAAEKSREDTLRRHERLQQFQNGKGLNR